MKTFLLLPLILTLSYFSNAQSLAINTDGSTANSSAILDVKSVTKGLLIPRLTKTEKNAVVAPATGLLVYQTGPDSTGFYYYQNSRWNWLTDNRKADSSYWSLHGNENTSPPSSNNNVPINFYTDTYLGTNDFQDISFVAAGNELLRLKWAMLGGKIGLSNRNPEYGLDMRLTDQSPVTDIVGMRIISNQLFDLGNSNLNKGLVIGNNKFNPNEMVIWNHANNLDATIRIGFDLFGAPLRPPVNIDQDGLGIYKRDPRYILDIHSRSGFTSNPTSTGKNGIRISYPFQEDDIEEQKGLFMGVDATNSYRSFIWNYADGSGGNSPDKAIYFGVGSDFGNPYSGIPTMELQDGKIAIGHLINPTFSFPSTLNIQTDYDASAAKNGISIMKRLTSQESVYFGTDVNDNLDLYKYNGGNIFLGNPGDFPITITSANYVGIKTFTPNAELQFGDTYANNKIVLHNNLHGNIPNNDHDFFGFGVNTGLMRYQVPRNNTAHVFYAGDINGTASNELMRITGNGYVGINFNNPTAPLEFNSGQENRKIVLAGFGANSDHNFFGFGRNNGELRYQVSTSSDDHVFYKGDASGFSSTELFRIMGTGDIGVGTNYTSAYGHTGTNRIVEIKNPVGGSNIQSHLILSSIGSSGSLGGITWASNSFVSGELRTAFIGNSFETANQTKLSFHTRSNTGILNESFYIQGTGNAWLAGTLTQASDARLKKNIQPLSSALSKLDKINGYTYNWINDQRDTEEQIGLLAQEVQKNYPQLVKQNDNGELSVNYSGLVPVLLEGIKEQQKQIEALKDQNLQQQLQIESILKKIK